MHTCPNCGQACYCCGDIDDIDVGYGAEACDHCNGDEIDDEEECGAHGGGMENCPRWQNGCCDCGLPIRERAKASVVCGEGFRLVDPGERLKKHDQGLYGEDGQWHEIAMAFLGYEYTPGLMNPVRRKIDMEASES